MSISALPWKVGAIESGQVAIDSADDKEVTGFIEEDDALHILNLAKENTQLRAENASLKAELAEAKKDADRLKGLRELCGYVEDGSSQTIRITQDDATNDWIIQWNGKAGWVFSSSFNGAIDEAMKGK